MLSKVEINREWNCDLLLIEDTNGQRYFYYKTPNGELVLGQPYAELWEEYKVTLFLPLPRDYQYPYVLNVKHLPERQRCDKRA